MPLPTAFSAPVTSLSPTQRRIFSWTTGAALFALLCWMAWLRSIRPQWPVGDPDTWGYLYPGLSKLLGGSFEHINGRNFVYPGWIYLLLRATNDFRAIPVAQHLLGLAGTILVWVSWRQWRQWFTSSRLPAWADALLGLGVTTFFGAASSIIHFEEEIRPEAVFPFFAVLNLCLLLAFLQAWYVERRSQRGAVLAGISLFATALLYQLKPSFGLGMGFDVLPVVLALFVPAQQGAWRSRLRLLGAVAAAGLAVAALLALPEKTLAKNDPMETLFLPETLLTVHAGIIRDQMNEDVRECAATPYPVRWLTWTARYLDGEVRRAATEPSLPPYKTLGYNPDYLLYRDSFCRWLDTQLPPARIADFCFYYYARAWSQHPATMLAKTGRELGEFYSFHCPAFRSSTRLEPAQYYGKTSVSLAQPVYQNQLVLYPPGRTYLDAVRGFSSSSEGFQTPWWLVVADVIASVTYLLVMVLFLAGLVAVPSLPSGSRRLLWRSGAVLLLIYGICFGSCLTVALVHSLTMHRYTLNLLFYAVFCEAAALAWLAELGLVWRGTKPVPRLVVPTAIPFAGLPDPES